MKRAAVPLHWIASYFWVAYGVKQFLTRLLEGINGGAGGYAWLMFLVVMTGLLMSAWITGAVHKRHSARSLVALLLFVAWSGLALAWNYGSERSVAVGYWLMMCLEVAVPALLLMLSSDRLKTIVASLKGFCVGGLAYGGYAVYVATTQGMERLGDDTTLQTNFVGAYMAIGALAALFLYAYDPKGSRSIIWLAISSVLVLVLIRSLSKTSIGGFALGAFAFMVFARIGIKKRALVVTGAFAGAAWFFGLLLNYVLDYLYSQGGRSMESLSGRKEIWNEFISLILDRPLLGYGFFSVREFAPPIAARLGHATAHNELLTVWFTLGIVGVILWLVLYAQLIWLGVAACRKSSVVGAFVIAVMLFVMVRGVTEGVSYGLVLPLPLAVVLIALLSNGNSHHASPGPRPVRGQP